MINLQNFLCCLVATIFYLSQTANANALESNICPRSPKLNYLSDYTNVYTNIRTCLRVAYSKGITDSDGRIYISYRAPLNKGENPNELCQCIRKFILQGDWYIGATSLCYEECDTVTLLLIGTPEKKFVNATPVYEGKPPIKGLTDVFSIYSNAQVWKDKCLAKTGVNKAGFDYVKWTCDYSGPNLPSEDKLCKYIYAYANGGSNGLDILGNTASYSCTLKDKIFYLEIVANSK